MSSFSFFVVYAIRKEAMSLNVEAYLPKLSELEIKSSDLTEARILPVTLDGGTMHDN